MNIGIDIRCLMDKERSGVGEYAYQFLDNLFREVAALQGLLIEPEASFGPEAPWALRARQARQAAFHAQKRAQKLFDCDLGKCEFFLFYNSWRDVSVNLPKWNYPFVHYCGFRWPNKALNFCLRFLKWPKLDKLIPSQKCAIAHFCDGTESERIETIERTKKIAQFIFLNQNFYALSKDVKKIIIVHDLSQEIYPECFSLKSRLWHKMVNLRQMAQEADQIIAVSENTKFDLINLYRIDPKRITVLYPSISLLRYTGVSEQRERDESQRSDAVVDAFTYSRELEIGKISNGHRDVRSPLDRGDLYKDCRPAGDLPLARPRSVRNDYILFLGTIEPRKNVLGLLKAYELFSLQYSSVLTYSSVSNQAPPELWIAGKAGYRSKEVFNYWKKMRARDKVKFLGYVDEQKKWELYRNARAFIYPSFYEGFGMPVLEAQSLGTPIITSLTSSMPEVVGNRGILVDPNRIEDLAQAVGLYCHCEVR